MSSVLPELTDEQVAALDVLRSSQRTLLVGHEAPDGDCLGAQAGLISVLEALGTEVVVVNPDLPDAKYRFLTEPCGMQVFDGQLPEHDVCCLIDCSELGRTGAMAEPLAAAPSKKVVVDHHVPPQSAWWDAAFTDVTSSATGLLVWRMASVLGLELDPTGLEGIFTSLATDTGWFKHANTDAETLRASAELADLGVSPAGVYTRVFQRRAPGYPRHVGRILSKAEYFLGGRLAVADVSPEDRGAAAPETDHVLDVLGSVEEVEVILLLREVGDGSCKVSARSKTDFDVAALAREFGGGGHARASGARVLGPLAAVRDRLVSATARTMEACA